MADSGDAVDVHPSAFDCRLDAIGADGGDIAHGADQYAQQFVVMLDDDDQGIDILNDHRLSAAEIDEEVFDDNSE